MTSRLILPVFLIAQAFDGIFTYLGVHTFGLVAEGNLLLATWMGLVGAGPAIIGAKVMAAGCGLVLYSLGVHRVLLGLTLFYGVAAIAPWLIVFHQI